MNYLKLKEVKVVLVQLENKKFLYMLIKQEKYSYNDVMIQPSVVSSLSSRSEANPYDVNGMLPLFTAPMDCVVCEKNYDLFTRHRIYAIMPRTIKLEKRIEYVKQDKWVAFSLAEFEKLFVNKEIEYERPMKVLVDIANGHMLKLFELAKKAKDNYGDDLVLMIGNIANPNTYEMAAKIGVDYIRCSIGTGKGCLSSSNVGVHYPIASLIDEIASIKETLSKTNPKLPKIIADGGVRNYSDVIKALALGADYVMIGGVFASMFESAAETREGLKLMLDHIDMIDEDYKRYLINRHNIHKTFYGMSTKRVQMLCDKKELRTSEGLECTLLCKYTMKQWVDNFTDYLRSAMSYTNCNNLWDFTHTVNLYIISNSTKESINK